MRTYHKRTIYNTTARFSSASLLLGIVHPYHSSQVVWRKQGPPPQTPDATYIEGLRPQTPRTPKFLQIRKNHGCLVNGCSWLPELRTPHYPIVRGAGRGHVEKGSVKICGYMASDGARTLEALMYVALA